MWAEKTQKPVQNPDRQSLAYFQTNEPFPQLHGYKIQAAFWEIQKHRDPGFFFFKAKYERVI